MKDSSREEQLKTGMTAHIKTNSPNQLEVSKKTKNKKKKQNCQKQHKKPSSSLAATGVNATQAIDS